MKFISANKKVIINLFFAIIIPCCCSFVLASEIHFETRKIQIGKVKNILVEIADTEEKQERGLMFRKSLPKDQGMLFIFEIERPLSFWMKNTFIDLSIAYINANKEIIDIQDMKSTNSMQINFPNYPSKYPAKYALEMNLGWFKKNKISVGQKVNWK